MQNYNTEATCFDRLWSSSGHFHDNIIYQGYPDFTESSTITGYDIDHIGPHKHTARLKEKHLKG